MKHMTRRAHFQLTNVTGVSVVMGMSAVCGTLYPQLYGGLNKMKLGTLVIRDIVLNRLVIFC